VSVIYYGNNNVKLPDDPAKRTVQRIPVLTGLFTDLSRVKTSVARLVSRLSDPSRHPIQQET
jgi:hypothetical protein